MFCMNCGKELPDQAKFCFYCGSQVTLESDKQEPVIPGPELPGHMMVSRPATPITGPMITENPSKGAAQGGNTPGGPQQGERPVQPRIPRVLETGKPAAYVPPIMPTLTTQSDSKTVFRVGHARNVEKILQVGVELAGLGILTLLIRVILLALINWQQAKSNTQLNLVGDDKSLIFTELVAFMFILATCILSIKSDRRLWLGLLPPVLILSDSLVEMVKTNQSYSSDYYGYSVGWDQYKGQIILLGIYLVIYLIVVVQRKAATRWGAGVLLFYAMLALALVLWRDADTAFVAVAAEETKVAWYELFCGIAHICFHVPYMTLALRQLLAKKE